jgi:hypothetical protein
MHPQHRRVFAQPPCVGPVQFASPLSGAIGRVVDMNHGIAKVNLVKTVSSFSDSAAGKFFCFKLDAEVPEPFDHSGVCYRGTVFAPRMLLSSSRNHSLKRSECRSQPCRQPSRLCLLRCRLASPWGPSPPQYDRTSSFCRYRDDETGSVTASRCPPGRVGGDGNPVRGTSCRVRHRDPSFRDPDLDFSLPHGFGVD